jgi:predicted nucleic acid-binding Zn ribbon protein
MEGTSVTRQQVFLAGIRRMLIVFVLLSAAAAGVALLFIWLMDARASRAFPLVFYLGGALIALGGFLSAQTGQQTGFPWGRGNLPAERGLGVEERQKAFSNAIVYAGFGIALIVVGVVLDAKL